MSFPQRLKELRQDKKLTQKELSLHLGLSANSICEWEKGRCEPGIAQLLKLSSLFECSIDFSTGNADDFGVISIKNEKPALALSQDEQKLLETYRKLNTKNKIHVATYADIRLEEQDDVPPSISRKKI